MLPCGAGKTLVGLAAMAEAQATTLILVTNTVAARQWRSELLRRTTLTEAEIGEYSGAKKDIRPVTIATYQVMTTRRKGVYTHLEVFDSRDWGLIVYDEVHLLPAPIFRFTADIQSRRRLGLTATLVREDGREGDVFSLIGPKRYDAPWKDIEAQGYIAPADCVEVRVTLTDHERMVYATAEPEERYRLASTTDTKNRIVERLVERHRGDSTRVIGQYLDQLDERAEHLGVPIIKGSTTCRERERLYDAFRRGEVPTLVVRRWRTSPVTCPRPPSRFRSPGHSDHARRRRSGSAGSCAPRRTDAVRASIAVVARDTVDQEYAAHRPRSSPSRDTPTHRRRRLTSSRRRNLGPGLATVEAGGRGAARAGTVAAGEPRQLREVTKRRRRREGRTAFPHASAAMSSSLQHRSRSSPGERIAGDILGPSGSTSTPS